MFTLHLENLGENDQLDLNDLTPKTAMLTSPSRLADLIRLNLDQRRYSSDGITYMCVYGNQVGKTVQANKEDGIFIFPLKQKAILCGSTEDLR